MTKVSLAVAAHTVEVEADEPLVVVAATVMRLYRESAEPARLMTLGFDRSPPVMERAAEYVEPRWDQEEQRG